MKVTNWRKSIAVAIAAAGISVPGVARAVNIPVPDADFKAYTVSPSLGYAYANSYRPTSPWVDDLEHNANPYVQDNASSNWLYNAAYSDYKGSTSTSNHWRGAPRGGASDQAMHGFFRYNAQKLSNTFQPNTLYTFSIWAQGDADAAGGAADSATLYLFDGTIPFTEASSLTYTYFQGGSGGAFNNRVGTSAGSDHAASIANWTQLSVSYFVGASSPAIGHQIGVGFYVGEDAAVDDASLSATPEPTTVVLAGLGGVSLLALRRRRQ